MLTFLLGISHRTSVRMGEIGFLLILVAGIWLVVAEFLPTRLHRLRMIVAGLALAVAGILLFIAAHWGTFR